MKTEFSYDGGLVHISDIIGEMLMGGFYEAAETVAERARAVCPVDTGALRSSIAVSQEGLSAEISANTDYAVYVEFGTSKMAAQPYLVPSLIDSADEITGIIANALGGKL